MDFFGELMTYQKFEDLPLYGLKISQTISTVSQNWAIESTIFDPDF